MSEGQQTDPLVFILFCSDSQDIDWYRFSSTRAGCFGQWFCLSSLSFSIPLSHWRCLSVFSLSHTLSHVSTQLNFISGINFCMYIPLSLKKKRKENKEKHTVVFLNVGLKKKHVNVRFGGGFWKTKSCILCKGFRLGERLGDMLLNSCNGGRYVWWAFVITPNEFEGLHEFFINVKVNQRTGNGKRKDAANTLPRWVWEDLHTQWEEAQTGTDKGLRQREMGWLWPDSELSMGENEKRQGRHLIG